MALSRTCTHSTVHMLMLLSDYSLLQALSWSMYRLCTLPHIQDLVRDEVKTVLKCGHGDKTIMDERSWPTHKAIQNMKYLDAFCMEVSEQ